MDTEKVHFLKTPPGADASADVRRALRDTVDFINQLHGGHLAGFAMVAWDHQGSAVPVTFHGRLSPMSDDMVPSYAMTQFVKLNMMLTQEDLGDDPATEG